MQNDHVQQYIATLAPPFCHEEYRQIADSISDRDGVGVYLNEYDDFAFLFPPVEVDYGRYLPRSKKLGLTDAKKSDKGLGERYHKIKKYLCAARCILEVGAADGCFVDYIHQRHPDLSIACLEPDMDTRGQRAGHDWLTTFTTFDQVIQSGMKFDLIGCFHVLEHVLGPIEFLNQFRASLDSGGMIVLEVPALTDPLVSVYQVEAYRQFFYQSQHPFVYSATSMRRLLEANGWGVAAMLAYQRYGLSNHLHWLRAGKPGDDERLSKLFDPIDASYRRLLEQEGTTDTVIAVAHTKSEGSHP